MLLAFFIFFIILILYVHIQEQYKKCEDLEVYEMDYSTREHLQEVCAMKQPVLFAMPLPEDVINVYYDANVSDETTTHTSEEIPVWDIREYAVRDSVEPIWLSHRSFLSLAKSDPKGHFFTRKNGKNIEGKEALDDLLRPSLTGYSDIECLSGSAGAWIPLQYHMDDRTFFFVTKGKISVRMTPWRSRRFLSPVADYENYEFFSKTNPWTSSEKELRWIDFDVVAGHVLYIPAWWWYSIRFSSVETEVIGIRYLTFGNIIAHVPDWIRYYIQFHATQRIPMKPLDTILGDGSPDGSLIQESRQEEASAENPKSEPLDSHPIL